jgi:hypothetical protein
MKSHRSHLWCVVPGLRRVRRWSIAIYAGASPFALSTAPGVTNPVLTARDVNDVSARYVADPFMIRKGSGWYMFFEVLDETTGRGKIAYAESANALNWTYKRVVVDEPFHLSYPYVFACNNEIYMVPESGNALAVRLYRAVEFPIRWEFAGDLLAGKPYCDSSLVRYHDYWWLFAVADPARNDSLCLYRSERLEGPWTEHPRSPVVTSNPHLARPAGRIFECDGRLFRYAQDDSPWYGRQVWALEVTKLTPADYAEKLVTEHPVLRQGRFGWNSLGMHHVDPHPLGGNRWIACVDGHRNALSVGFVRKS